MRDWDFIEQAALELGVGPDALRKWREPERGVPAKWRLPILDLARERRFKLNREAFDQPPGPKRYAESAA